MSTVQTVPASGAIAPNASNVHPIVAAYFAAFNQGQFETVSRLFAIDGALQPPFEALVISPAAIATYLHQEATELRLEPQTSTAIALDNGCTQIEVTGRVYAPWFTVNVAWTFILSPLDEIFLVKINLLASLKELLPLRHFAKGSARSLDAAD